MRIAVTGGLGFIGTSLVRRLREGLGAEVRILDNLDNPSGDLVLDGDIELIEGDVRDYSTVEKFVDGADTVIHLAAHTRVIDSIAEPRLNFDINVSGTFNVLEAMRRKEIETFVGASTGGAILGEVPPPINEDIAAQPASPYGASKLAGEGYCWAYAQSYGMKATSLRFSNIYGPHSRHKGSVVAAFIKDICARQAVTVYGDGSQTRDYLHVSDLAGGIVKAIETGVSGVFQLGSGRPTSLNELIAVMRETIPIEFDVTYEDFRPGEIVHTYCDIAKARDGFGFDPATSLRQGVEDTWNWFAEGQTRGA